MRRRGAGIGAIKNKSLAQAKYMSKATDIASDQLSQMSKQLESFRSYLEEFASKHKDKIRKNAQFRGQFQEMCASIGVDPLASSKGFWAQKLGVGDFYYELGVQIVEVCLATNHRNGGLMSLDELRERVTKSRGSRSMEISNQDLMCAIKKLKALGNGFTVIPFGDKHLVQSVPGELTMDHTTLLQQAEGTAMVTLSQIQRDLGWEEERVLRALDYMVKEGLAWVDSQDVETQYWFPGLFPECSAAS